jgi:hypothetical protein
MKRFINWLTGKISPRKASPEPALWRTGAYLKQTGSHLHRTGGHTISRSSKPPKALPARQPEFVELDPRIEGKIEDRGPGKNALIRNKYLREDTGTHETLKILDDSIVDTEEESGLDPYNTGQFDRAKNWDKRRK